MEKNMINILDFVCNYYQVSIADVISKSRKTEHKIPRFAFSYLAKHTVRKARLKDIGRFLGGRDHSTIINQLDNVETSLEFFEKHGTWDYDFSPVLQYLRRYEKNEVNYLLIKKP